MSCCCRRRRRGVYPNNGLYPIPVTPGPVFSQTVARVFRDPVVFNPAVSESYSAGQLVIVP